MKDGKLKFFMIFGFFDFMDVGIYEKQNKKKINWYVNDAIIKLIWIGFYLA